MNLHITNIQRFSLHDGPGIRTTVFLKGCSSKCPWCANPEAITFGPTFLFDSKKCIKKNDSCLLNSNCPLIKSQSIKGVTCEDAKKCTVGALKNSDNVYDTDSLLSILKADSAFFGKEGGVTFSGGEALLQAEALVPLLEDLKKEKINVAFETCLNVPLQNLQKVLDFADFFYVDVKSLDSEKASEYLGINVENYKNNLRYLFNNFDNEKIVLRFPLVKDYTFNDYNLELVKNLINELNAKYIEIFSVHNLGESKYKMLQLNYSPFEKVDFETLSSIKDYLENNTCAKVSINKI